MSKKHRGGTGAFPVPPQRFSHDLRYSVFDSAPGRMREAKWLFPQEKTTSHDVGNVKK
jgi:hypothetical protein